MQNTNLQKGQHKALSDIVTNISPDETPFMTLIGKGRVTNVLFHWTEEELDPSTVNAQVEGAVAPAAVDNYLIERDNYTQIFARTVSVSGTSVANKTAGGVEALAHQVELKAKTLKIDMEKAFIGNFQTTKSVVGSARYTAGFAAQVDSANIIDKAGTYVTAEEIDEMLTRLYEAGAKPDYIMCHPRVRNALVAVLQAKGFVSRDIGDSTALVTDIVTYTSPVGTVKLVNNRHARFDSAHGAGDIYFFDSSMWSVETLRPYQLEELAKTGDSMQRLLVVECGLKNKNFKSAGIITTVLVG